MPPQPLESRVESLEHRVSQLEQLRGRIDDLTSQISQLRTEMRAEFSAVRGEIGEQGQSLRAEIGALATHMRVLHEDVISRFARLEEGWSGTPRRRPRKKSASPGCLLSHARSIAGTCDSSRRTPARAR
jgi:cell division protein FtsB